jgi:hypothetical protein
MRKMVRAGAGAGIFDKQEPEPHKNRPAPQLCPWATLPSLIRPRLRHLVYFKSGVGLD